MRVGVYFNLHKRMFSVRAMDGENKGRVVRHLPECAVRDVKFVVSEAGRQRVLREQKKNVHAYVRGELVDESKGYVRTVLSLAENAGTLRMLKYNPHMYNSFVEVDTEEPVHEADVCLLQVIDGYPEIYAV